MESMNSCSLEISQILPKTMVFWIEASSVSATNRTREILLNLRIKNQLDLQLTVLIDFYASWQWNFIVLKLLMIDSSCKYHTNYNIGSINVHKKVQNFEIGDKESRKVLTKTTAFFYRLKYHTEVSEISSYNKAYCHETYPCVNLHK